jgi:flagellar basal-body rod modification protein FlgD
VETITAIDQLNSANASASAGMPDAVDKEAFLQLLVTQLKYQDPLSPISNEEFLAQLAQFSSLEQLQSINTGTQTGLLLQQSVTNSLSTALIGKDVLVGTDAVTIAGGQPVDFYLSLGGTGRVTAEIHDEDGSLVRTLEIPGADELPLTEGEHGFTWDGLDEAGEAVPDGTYTISVEASDDNGLPVMVSSYLSGHVDGIRFAAGSAYIVIGDMEFTLADIVEIREPGAEAAVASPTQSLTAG